MEWAHGLALALMTIKQLLLQVILQKSSQQNRWPFCEDTLGRQVFSFFHLSLSPEVGVYKVGLIDESSVNSLHLVRVWKSGEDVGEKKMGLGQRERELLRKWSSLSPKKRQFFEKWVKLSVAKLGQTFFHPCPILASVPSDNGERKGASELHCLDSHTFTCT